MESNVLKIGRPVEIHSFNIAIHDAANKNTEAGCFLFCIHIDKADACLCNLVPLRSAVIIIIFIYVAGGLLSLANQLIYIFSPLPDYIHLIIADVVSFVTAIAALLTIEAIKKRNVFILKVFYITMMTNTLMNVYMSIMVRSWSYKSWYIACTALKCPIALYMMYIVYSYYGHLANGNLILADIGKEAIKMITNIHQEDASIVKGVAIA